MSVWDIEDGEWGLLSVTSIFCDLFLFSLRRLWFTIIIFIKFIGFFFFWLLHIIVYKLLVACHDGRYLDNFTFLCDEEFLCVLDIAEDFLRLISILLVSTVKLSGDFLCNGLRSQFYIFHKRDCFRVSIGKAIVLVEGFLKLFIAYKFLVHRWWLHLSTVIIVDAN